MARHPFRTALVALLALGGVLALGPGDGVERVQQGLAWDRAAAGEPTNMTVNINGVEYNGALDPQTGLGHLSLTTDEWVQLLADEGSVMAISDSEGCLRQGIQDVGGFLGTGKREDRKTVDYFLITVNTMDGQTFLVRGKVDNRTLGQDHIGANLNVWPQDQPLPNGCREMLEGIGSTIVNMPSTFIDAGGKVVDGAGNVIGGAVDRAGDVVGGIRDRLPGPFGND